LWVISSEILGHEITLFDITANPLPLIDAIHQRKMKAGVAISPDTPSVVITDEIAAAADMLLVMTVYPGT
jgi:ribulose-phosphate 3-epimerase